MKVARVGSNGRCAAAIIDGGRALIIEDWVAAGPTAPFRVAERSLADLKAAAENPLEILALEDVELMTPVDLQSKLFCIGVNYRDHAEEAEREIAPEPSLFIKLSDVLVGHDRPIIRPQASERFDYEGEIAVVIGEGGRHISKENALSHIFGYTNVLDGSLRDFQRHSLTAGKNFWRSGSCGPWIVTADEIPDPSRLRLETRLNGEVVQAAPADAMIYDIPFIIQYISSWTPLAPGDLIATGTPAGVGARRSPPLWMRHGDRIEVEVSGVGVLGNLVQDEPSAATVA